VAAIIVVGVTEGARGYRDWGARMLRWRVGWSGGCRDRHPAGGAGVASAANVAIWGAPAPVLTALPGRARAVRRAALVNPLDGPFGEEPGWAATRCPSCRSGGRRSPRALLAPIVALWHLPLWPRAARRRRHPHHVRHHLVYVWLFNRTGGSVLLTIAFHIAQGTFSYACWLRGRRRRRMDWIVGVLWFAIARAVIAFDGRRGGGPPVGSGAAPALTVWLARVGPFSGAGPAPCAATLRADHRRRHDRRLGPAPRPGDTLLAQRFGAERRTSVVWVLWVLGAAATFGALRPRAVPPRAVRADRRRVPDRRGLVRRCGLVAWRRRPDNHSGLLMTATGFALFASPLLAQVGSPLAKTSALVLPDLWVVSSSRSCSPC
jgi:hypothetical protein